MGVVLWHIDTFSKNVQMQEEKITDVARVQIRERVEKDMKQGEAGSTDNGGGRNLQAPWLDGIASARPPPTARTQS